MRDQLNIVWWGRLCQSATPGSDPSIAVGALREHDCRIPGCQEVAIQPAQPATVKLAMILRGKREK